MKKYIYFLYAIITCMCTISGMEQKNDCCTIKGIDTDFVTPYVFEDILILECVKKDNFQFFNTSKEFVIYSLLNPDTIIYKIEGITGLISPNYSKIVVEKGKEGKKVLCFCDLMKKDHITFGSCFLSFDTKALKYCFSTDSKLLLVEYNNQFEIYTLEGDCPKVIYNKEIIFDQSRYTLENNTLLIEGIEKAQPYKCILDTGKRLVVLDIANNKILFNSEDFAKENTQLYKYYLGEDKAKLFVEYSYYYKKSRYASDPNTAAVLVIVDLSQDGNILYQTNDFTRYHRMEACGMVIFENRKMSKRKEKNWISIVNLQQKNNVLFKKPCDHFELLKEKKICFFIEKKEVLVYPLLREKKKKKNIKNNIC